jgi:hypothetical protein
MSFYVIDPDLARALLREAPPPADAPAVASEAEDPRSDQGPLALLVCAFAALAVLSAVVPWS